MKKITAILLAAMFLFGLTACESAETGETVDTSSQVEGEIFLAAAASLEKTFTEQLLPMFQKQYPDITVEGTYDSSGKLQTQIEEGAAVDIFFSAAVKQMDALSDEGLILEESRVELLENKIVLIVPTGSEEGYASFQDIVNADMIAIGDPESVPAGQYGKEALENLGLWEEVELKLSLGTNVTEVLNWVAEGSANAGIVYATDAASMPEQVKMIAEAPEGSVVPVVYPVAILQNSKNQEASELFLAFLQSKEALEVFENTGFSINQ